MFRASAAKLRLFDATTGNLLTHFGGSEFNIRRKKTIRGEALAINGHHVLIGAPSDDTNAIRSGQAHLFDAVTGNLLFTFDDPTDDSEVNNSAAQ